LAAQDRAIIHHHDLVGEQPIPHFYCQKCTKEMVILWDPQAAAEGEYRAIGVLCPTCFDPAAFERYFEKQDPTQGGEFY
jgi:hypothetical protein